MSEPYQMGANPAYPEPAPMASAPMATAPPAPSAPPAGAGAASAEQANLSNLQAILQRYEITIADANDLVALQGYEIVFIADDSGSMSLSSVPLAQRRLGAANPSRWDELCGTMHLVVELACCFDDDGVDIFFLNRPPLFNVTSVNSPLFQQAMNQPPSGGTPLTERFTEVVRRYSSSEKPVLLVVATDGEPNGGVRAFRQAVVDAVTRRSTNATVKVQILACTEDDSSVGYLNEIDDAAPGIDVMDDYYSERQEVLRAGRVREFRRSDWLIKALLGPVVQKYDDLDQQGRPMHSRPAQHKGNVEQTCCAVL